MKSLDQIGIEEGSDRSSKVHNYLAQYETFLESFRSETIEILEIGGRTASSARLWTRFFPNATLHVVDTHPTPELGAIDRVEVHKLERFTSEALEQVTDDVRPTLVLDDGTHRWSHQMMALRALLPSLRPGGLFIIEDLQTSYGTYEKTHGDTEESTADFLLRLASRMLAGPLAPSLKDTFERYLASSLDNVAIIRQAAILHKKASTETTFVRKSLAESEHTIASVSNPNESYSRVDGELLDPSIRRQRAFEKIRDVGIVHLNASTSGIIKNATVHGSGLTVTEDGIIVSETLNNIENVAEYATFFKVSNGDRWSTSGSTRPEYVEKLPGRQHVLLKGAWDSNYGHWLYDVLPRLQLLKKLQLMERPLLVISPRSGGMTKVVYDTLALAGFDPRDIVEHDGRPRKYQSLAVLGRTSSHPILKAPSATRFLEDITVDIPAGREKRIYLSRNAYTRRRLTNEDELTDLLISKGFHIAYPENLSFAEQVSLLKGAKFVAGNMGAAFSSLAFSPKGVNVLTLSTPSMPHDFFYDIVCHKEGRYVGVQGTSTDARPGMGSDFQITKSQLLRGLEKIGAS